MKLKTLDLSGLALATLPSWLAKLNLEDLSAVDNQLTADAVNSSLEGYQGLKVLNLGWNPLGEIPQCIFEMRGLRRVGLPICNITKIPPDILRLTQLERLDLSGNQIESPPQEVVSKGLGAILRYWRQRESVGVDYLCEAKLIIVGEPGAGKTSLAQKIRNPEYKLKEREPSTEGIDVIGWQFPAVSRKAETSATSLSERDSQVNIWDFGGQEIYQATHQFFLTRRSVYLLVCDDRKEDTDFEYWLNTVELLSDGSPLLIVQNEKQDRTRDVNLSQLRAKFPASLIGALALNLDTNRGLDAALSRIRSELERLPHIGVGLPASWKRVREALEKDPRDYIDLSEYLDICQKHGFSRREDKLQLSDYLHDLGICLHFQNDPVLKNTVILKPTWGTAAVYRVIDDAKIIAARGKFSKRDLSRIWSEPKYANMTTELLHLMMKFQLCYALDDGETFIAPQLLSPDPPPYKWDSSAETVVRYQYDFLPKGILTRLIVATNHLVAEGSLVWKTGVVLEKDASRAEVIQDYGQRRITVRVTAQARSAFSRSLMIISRSCTVPSRACAMTAIFRVPASSVVPSRILTLSHWQICKKWRQRANQFNATKAAKWSIAPNSFATSCLESCSEPTDPNRYVPRPRPKFSSPMLGMMKAMQSLTGCKKPWTEWACEAFATKPICAIKIPSTTSCNESGAAKRLSW